jgi:hypothetical protein
MKWNKFFGEEMPKRISGTKVSRIIAVSKESACPHCFPHGHETSNSHIKNRQKSWKKHRSTQYKSN